MIEKDIEHYPQEMKKASQNLLYNEKLANAFVCILYKKSRVNDPY